MESTGFQVHACICDGASWNLTMLKHLCGCDGKFGFGEMTDPDRYDVLCSFKNPFSDNKVWIIICPSHQVHLHCVILPGDSLVESIPFKIAAFAEAYPFKQ